MYRLACTNCKSNNDFYEMREKPIECAYCFSVFDNETVVEEIEATDKGQLIGIKLIYQQTGQEININTPYAVLGREHEGSDILCNIKFRGNPVISRKHCSLTLINNSYWIKDEDSSNGTFSGIDKISCKEPQLLLDGGIIFLGKETFITRFVYQIIENNPEETDTVRTEISNETDVLDNSKSETVAKAKFYRCNEACGYESETFSDICPRCFTMNSLVEVNK